MVLNSLGLVSKHGRAHTNQLYTWIQPTLDYIKANNDGIIGKKLGYSWYGIVYRNLKVHFLRVVAKGLGIKR